MDALKNALGGSGNKANTQNPTTGGNEGGFMGKVNNSMGGGQAGERNEGPYISLCSISSKFV